MSRLPTISTLLLLAVIVLASACTPPGPGGISSKPYFHDSLETGHPGMNVYSAPAPGQSTVLPREYPGAPPLVPHDISGFDITKDANACLACHSDGISFGEGHVATKIPPSHYTSQSTGEETTELQGLRYNCNICHIPQSEEQSLWCFDCHN